MAEADTVPVAAGALPLIGHAGRLARDRLGFLEETRALGPVVRIRLGRTPAYVVHTPALVQRMQVAGNGVEFDKGGPFFDQAARIVGEGISTAACGPHRPMRARLRPVFTPRQVARHTERFRDCAEELSAGWRPGRVIDAYTEMKRFAVAVLARTLFLAPGDRHTVEVVQRNVPLMLSVLAHRMMVPGSQLLPTAENVRYARAARETRSAVGELVRRRLRDTADHGDLVSALVPPGRPHTGTEQEVFDQVITFFIAGTETVASLLAWTLHLLSEHPREYERLEAELDGVLGDRPVTHEDLPRLTHLRQVLNESLRLHPPVWLLSRVTLVDTEMGGHVLPAGAGVLFSPYTLHRDPEVFTDPDRFDPGRWEDGRVARRHREAFMPFGAGARRCIGENFGVAEVQVALAVLLRRWRIRRQPGARPEPLLRMTMQPKGVRLVLDRRND